MEKSHLTGAIFLSEFDARFLRHGGQTYDRIIMFKKTIHRGILYGRSSLYDF